MEPVLGARGAPGAPRAAGWAGRWRGPLACGSTWSPALWLQSPPLPRPAGSGCSRDRSTPPALPAPSVPDQGLRCGCPRGVWPGPARPWGGPSLADPPRGPSRRRGRPTQDPSPGAGGKSLAAGWERNSPGWQRGASCWGRSGWETGSRPGAAARLACGSRGGGGLGVRPSFPAAVVAAAAAAAALAALRAAASSATHHRVLISPLLFGRTAGRL